MAAEVGHRSSWPRVALKSLVDQRGITYGVVQPGDRRPDGTPLLRVNNFTPAGLRLDDTMRIDPAIAERHKRSTLRGGEVLITLVGSVGLVAVAPRSLIGWNVARAVGVIPLRPEVSPKWVAWCLGTADARRYLDARLNTTVQKTLNLRDLAELEIPLPPENTVRAVESVLGALDAKIDSNRRLRRTADEVAAQALRAFTCRGRNEPTTTGSLIEQGLLSIGDGFRAKNSELAPDGIPFARAGNLNDGFDFTGADRVPEPLLPAAVAKRSCPGDVAFTSKGTVGRFAFVDRWVEPFVYSPQLCYWRSLDVERLPPAVLLWWIQGTEAKRQFDALKGQTDMADYVSLRDQRSMVISLPDDDEIQRLRIVLEPLAGMSGIVRAESQTLARLRDALLPKLISGEICVPDTKDLAEGIEPSAELVTANR